LYSKEYKLLMFPTELRVILYVDSNDKLTSSEAHVFKHMP